ncbi:three-Cys-motif partner protein TcmP [Natronorubrum sp. FCH18a]|uniref:three-Cys-motif partner protein TcmP n=1 Tax=Natronorubrum sp. FCH18a TaxID=3447018 RepID=UPI003F50DF23
MPLDDSDPDKWHMKEHTEVKHRILRKYLTTWTRIVSSGNPEIHYFDGFAGRARYEDGEPGSPLLALDVANRSADLFDIFHCTYNDYSDENYQILKEEVKDKKNSCENNTQIDEVIFNEEFEDIAIPVLDSEKYSGLPSMVFIDPFGYSGTPFNVISKIMNLQSSGNEVFFNFMVDTIRRFLDDESKEETITRAFGSSDWKSIRKYTDREKQEEEILKLYVSQLKEEAGVKYVFPFQMKHPDKNVTVYYLIHATNHFKGFKAMKDVMFNEGADDNFAYLGSDHYGYEDEQTNLFEVTASEDLRIKELRERLLSRYNGDTVSFNDILKFAYLNTDLIDTHCRKALTTLESQDKIHVDRGSSTRGFKEEYDITFRPQNQRLTDF